MNIIVNRRDFISAANTAAKATDKKSAAITKNVMITASAGIAEITGYDLNVGVVTTVSAAIANAGGICVDAAKVSAFLSKCSEDRVELLADEHYNLTMKCGKAKATIAGVSTEDYPALPKITAKNSCKLPAQRLSDLINNTIHCIPDDATKPVLRGMLIDIQDRKITAVGCDGYRVSEMVVENTSAGAAKAIIPKSATKILKLLCGDIEIQLDNNMAKFVSDNCTLYTRTINGDYVNYTPLLSRAEHKQEFSVNAADLLNALDKASAINDDITRPICARISEDTLTIVYKGSNATYTEDISIKLKGEPAEIGMNIRFLSEALKNADIVNISAAGAKGGIIITEENKRQMIMPVRLK